MEFLLHNGSRSRNTRMLRASQPEHGGHKQYVLGSDHRLVRGRPLRLSEDMVKRHLKELVEKESKGLVYLTTLQLVPVDMATLQVIAEPVPVSPPPAPRLDSAKFDAPSGERMNPTYGESPPPAEFTMPVAAPTAALENNPLVVEKVEEVAVVEAPVEDSVEEPTEENTSPGAVEVVEKPVTSTQSYGGKRRGGR